MVELRAYLDIVNPYKFEETMKREAKVDNPLLSFVNILIVTVLATFRVLVTYYLYQAQIGVYSPTYWPPHSLSPMVPLALTSPLAIIFYMAYQVIIIYFDVLIWHYIAKVFGGVGRFGNLLWTRSLTRVPISVLFSVLLFLFDSFSGWIVCILLLPTLAFSLYMYYIDYKLLRAVYPNLTKNRAIGALLISVIIVILVGMAFSKIIFQPMLGTV